MKNAIFAATRENAANHAAGNTASAASGRQTSKEDPQRDIIQLNWKYYPIKLENIVRVTFLVREGEGVKKIRKKVWPFAKPGGEG